MLKEQAKLFSYINRLTDYSLLIISFGIAIFAEHLYHGKELTFFDSKSFHPYNVPIILIFWQILFFVYDRKKLYRRSNYFSFFRSVTFITLLGTLSLISLSFLLKEYLFHRTTVIAFGGISFTLLLAKRLGIKYFLEHIRVSGRNTRYILIVGSEKRAEMLIEEFEKHEEYGYVVSSVLDSDVGINGKKLKNYSIKSLEDFDKIIMKGPVDEVFFAKPIHLIPDYKEKVILLNSIGINFHVMVSLDGLMPTIGKYDVEPFIDSWYGLPVLSFHPKDKQLFNLLIKIYFEFLLSLIILLIFSPLFFIIPIIIKLNSPGPIFFKQTRIGYHGRRFKLLKFRTMDIDAEKQLDSLQELNEQTGPVFKLGDDPRITGVGKFLRKYSLDEIPQLINVLKGEMNLVGPRPPLPEEVDNYKTKWRRRLNMKPGITGLWQVSGRNNLIKFEDWVKLDLEYIDNWNLWLDIKIMFKTVPAMFRGSGR